MRTNIVISIVLSASAALAMQQTPSSSVRIKSDRRSVNISIQNPTPSDIFCADAHVNIQVAGDNFNDVIGTHSVNIGPIYLLGHERQEYVAGEAEIKSYGMDPLPIILNAEIRFAECREPTFQDYCEYAPKEASEAYTLEQLQWFARKNDCSLASDKIGKVLNLSGRGIENLKPVGFLTQLTRLDLSENKIEDLGPLKNLKALKSLNVSDNPVTDIGAVTGLPSIQTLQANRTQVYYGEYPRSPSLRRVELDDTPYMKRIRRPEVQ